jgi:23S rRNA-/tRNA-specific pseudouridylate synthase
MVHPVRHLVAASATHVSRLVAQELQISIQNALYLVDIGACYHKSHTSELSRKPQRVHVDSVVEPGDYLRVHPVPKRYDISTVDWPNIVVANTDDYVVVKKPSGIPTQASIDNFKENVTESMRRHFGGSMYPLHRLDVDTEGLMVIGKNPDFASTFNLAIRQGRITRRYRTLLAHHSSSSVDSLPNPGDSLVHWLEKSNHSPKRYSAVSAEGMLRAEMRIVSRSEPATRPVHEWIRFVQRAGCTPDLLSWFGTDSVKTRPLSFTEVCVELVTGRTHQVRGQMASLGPPGDVHVAGDNNYHGPTTAAELGVAEQPGTHRVSPALALQAYSLAFEDIAGSRVAFDLPAVESRWQCLLA